MGSSFFVQRGDKSFGPYSSLQLKALAQEGKLLREDVVRDSESGKSAKAKDIAGLFQPLAGASTPSSPQPVVVATIVEESPTNPQKQSYCRTCGKEVNENFVACPGCGVTPLAGDQYCPACGAQTLSAAVMCVKCGIPLKKTKTKSFSLFHSWPIVAFSLFLCFPIGHALVWTHPSWSRKRKIIWSGVWCLLVVMGMAMEYGEKNEVRQMIASADQLWNDGKKAQAASQYRAAINMGVYLIDKQDRSYVLSRVVDYAAENGNEDEARLLLQQYSDEGIIPESEAGKEIAAQVRVEKERVKAESQKLSREGPFESFLSKLSSSRMGKKITFGNGHVYYRSPVTEQEARRLGEFLVENGFFDDREKMVQVVKSDNTYQLRIPLKEGVAYDQYIDLFTLLGTAASEWVFNGGHVDIHLCDGSMETVRVVPCI